MTLTVIIIVIITSMVKSRSIPTIIPYLEANFVGFTLPFSSQPMEKNSGTLVTKDVKDATHMYIMVFCLEHHTFDFSGYITITNLSIHISTVKHPLPPKANAWIGEVIGW